MRKRLKPIRNLFLYITLFLPCVHFSYLNAQNQHFIFKHLTVEDGLSQSTVHAICKDRNGFMWFGTDIGLNKYDGYEFTVFENNASDTTSISSNFVVEIYEDSYGELWIGNGYNGLNRFDRKKEIFYRYNHNPKKPGSISNDNIRAIFEDSRKNLWVGTSGGGLNLYNRKRNNFTTLLHDPNIKSSLGSNFVSSITEDKTGNLWVGTTEGVLCKYDQAKKTFTNYSLYGNYKGDLYNTTFCSVYVDSENRVWFGTEIGLFVLDQRTNKFMHYKEGPTDHDLNAGAVSSILEFRKNIFMIATDHGGLDVLNLKTGKFTYYTNKRFDETSISNNQLYSIYRSSDSIIWIGSFHGGVNIYDPKAIKFQQYKYMAGNNNQMNCCNSVLTICEDPDKNIWIGNDGQGIDIINPKNGSVKHLMPLPGVKNSIPSNVVTEIYKDRNNDMWIGTYLEGMSKFDWKTKQYTHFKHNPENDQSIGGNNVWTIIEDKAGHLWLGTIGNGLDEYDKVSHTFRHFKNDPGDLHSLSNNDVFKVFEDSRGNIWAGTRNGLNKLDRKNYTFTRYNSNPADSNGIFGNWIYEIFEDSKGNLWVGTDIALNMLKPNSTSFIHYTEKNNLNGNAVFGILEDKKHNLWLSTNKGLSKFDPETKKFRNYSVADGLQSSEFNYTSTLLSSDGKMYFGGKNGFNVFNPDKIKDNQELPPVYLTKFRVADVEITPLSKNTVLSENINFVKNITLSYRQSVISFEFAALNYTNTLNNQYQYMLEGFDKDWSQPGTKREVTYTNLNPRTYTFKVKGSNNDDIWNPAITEVQVHITPPFWKRGWFYISEVVLILVLIYLYIKYRERRLRDDKKILQDKVYERTLQIELQKEELEQHRNHLEMLVKSRTEELITAKEKAEESDRLKSAFLANMSHEIRTPMNAIVGFSNLLKDPDISAEEKDEFIQLINSNSESLLVLIEDILDLSLIEANQVIIRKEVIQLDELVENIYSSFAVSNKKNNLQIRLNNNLKGNNIKIYNDKFRIKQILANLMNNAYKFTEKGFIELSVNMRNEKIEFDVKDTGIGISQEDIRHIFDRFRKLETDSTVKYRGAGLGLAISKRLAELLGGELKAESEPGVGSTFNFILPYEPVKIPDTTHKSKSKTLSLFNWMSKKILIVEDEKTNYLFLQKVLRKTNADILWAENGKEAVEMIDATNYFDIVLMDIKMPVMNGYEAAKLIREKNPAQIIIAQTAHARPEDEYKLRKAGFNDYLSKPIKPEFLFTVINKYI